MKKKRPLSDYTLPEEKRRRGSFVVRMALRRVRLRQGRGALRAAALMGLLIPLLQSALLVGVLKGEYWQMLLGLEGGVIALLAGSQLKRANVESRLIGYSLNLLNVVSLGAVGMVLGSSVFWLVGAIGILPLSWLALAPTRKRTVRRAWIAFAAPLALLFLFAGYARLNLVLSESETEPDARARQLGAAWLGLKLRGGNGTERALLRLRQAQAAFSQGDYGSAFEFAHDGVLDSHGNLQPIPESRVGVALQLTLLNVKAQAHYNRTWKRTRRPSGQIGAAPLTAEERTDTKVKVRWGW